MSTGEGGGNFDEAAKEGSSTGVGNEDGEGVVSGDGTPASGDATVGLSCGLAFSFGAVACC